MKKTSFLLMVFGMSWLLWASCEQHAAAPPGLQRAEKSSPQVARGAEAPPPPPAETATAADEAAPANAFVTSVAAVGKFDTLRKFIRTADLRFRVSNAVQTTLAVESIAAQNGGFVVENNLETSIESRNLTPVSADSMLETTRFTRHNQVTIRVPYTRLDTTLRSIGRLAEFLDYRRVKARDVGFDMLEQELIRARQQLYEAQVGRANSDKTRDVTLAADKLLESRTASDEARLNAMKIEDQIRYSTVQLDIYQDDKTQYRKVPRDRPVAAFRPGFGVKLAESLADGWELIQFLILGIVRLWAVLLLFGFGWYGWQKWRKR